MRKPLTAVVAAAALAAPVANAAQIAKKRPLHKKRVVTVKKKVVGAMGNAGQWGQVEITLLVKKTTTIVGKKKKKVKRRIVGVGVPIYPNHTGRSIFINEQALPYLRHEVLQAQFNPNIYLISGATYTSYAFVQSLQAALLKAKHV